MSNYACTIVQIGKVRKHSNADRLLCTNIFGNNIIVGLDTKEGDIGLYFPLEAQIGLDFAVANDLIRRKDENGKAAGGMFAPNRRVRAQTFRGEKSMGFFAPIETLKETFDYLQLECPDVRIGDEFEELNGVSISKKYIIPVNKQASKQKNSKTPNLSRMIDGQFHFHFETSQLGKNLFKLQPDSLIALSWKMHGTSAIAGHVLVKRPLTWYEKLAKKIHLQIEDTQYDTVYSSRKVVKNADLNPEKANRHYYSTDIWSDTGLLFRGLLHKGETVYYEIVGFTQSGQPIQKKFDYGCGPFESKVYIYRITQTNLDGIVTELSWPQVKHRASELGFETVPHIFYGYAEDLTAWNPTCDLEEWREQVFQHLVENYVYDQDSAFCNNKVPEEGIVVRIESGCGIECFKLKSFAFLQHESKMLDTGEADLESTES